MPEDSTEAALELTILSADSLPGTSASLLRRARPFAVAWVDPALKRTAKNLPDAPALHLPISPRALRDPASCVTIQILSPRAPFAGPKLVGSAELPLASVPAAAGKPLALPLCRRSGGARGSVRVSARILWCLGPAPASEWVTGVPVMDYAAFHNSVTGGLINVDPSAPPVPLDLVMMPPEAELPASLNVTSTAPPMGRDVVMISADVGGATFVNANPTALPVTQDTAVLPAETEECASKAEPVEAEGCGPKAMTAHKDVESKSEGSNAVRSFLLGLLSGAVAAVVVGAAGLTEG